ncbi:3'(2'),5'-bisphosphate nucleotidase CysQ [Tistrella sp. BH-R2-4]|uniref:3'(2'),5'-bisphosphate nucleotidase CysQ n=1 Tax=Tistrella arctica TaxID=3133430 RepID=A0ABU9YDC3_9PROT
MPIDVATPRMPDTGLRDAASPPMPALPDLAAVVALTRAAGQAIMALYGPGIDCWTKADDSPVTAADMAAHQVLSAGLAALTPDIPVISEEAVTAADLSHGAPAATFWLVDPLDGTREFLSRNGEFTVNAALIHDGRPVMGVVGIPATGRIYAGSPDGAVVIEPSGTTMAIAVRPVPDDGAVALVSRSHADRRTGDWLAAHGITRSRAAGSSLKLCLIAEGLADVYPRLGRTMEWDIAAGHAVLAAAGGHVDRLADGLPLGYGKPGLDNPDFIARGCWQSAAAI